MLDAIKLLRIPFSIFLMPVFWLALVNLNSPDAVKVLHVFVLIHLLLYPASNGYNCYFDRDEKSIGGLKHPPTVNAFLLPLVLIFDLLALIYAYLIQEGLLIFIAVYLLISKAYSHPKIRLKKYPLIGAIVVSVFQGAYTYFTVQYGAIGNLEQLWTPDNLTLAICSSIFLLGTYPLTQVYQHEEDRSRGDQTLSLLLGIKETFYWALIFFSLGLAILSWWILQHRTVDEFFIFIASTSPVLLYFGFWFWKVLKSPLAADFDHAMRMNLISSVALSSGFIYLTL